jgi:nucleotide-binding universal stress UspA family protein
MATPRNDNKVLACVDQSRYADYVTDAAAWAARRTSAPLELLHIIDRHEAPPPGEDHSGTIGFDAQEKLLDQLSAEDEQRTRDAKERGRQLLTRLRDRAASAGAEPVDIRQRYGELEETILEQKSGVRLVVLGRRGEAAETTQRDLGRNVESVVRALDRPILAVTEGFTPPRRIMFAFDGGAMTRRGVDIVAASPLFRGLPILLLMSGKASADASRKLEAAREKLDRAGFDVESVLIPGDAETVIARTAQERDIDLMIMGAFGHSPLRSLLFGSKTADLLRSSTLPTLLLR